MKIIIEGPDGSGKSTIAAKLAAQLHWDIIHMDKPKTEKENREMADMYVDLILKPGSFIMDRSWYSEVVYGPVMRGSSAITAEQLFRFEQILLNTDGAMVIYCTGDPGEMWERCQTRGETHITNYGQYLDIAMAYDSLFLRSVHRIPILIYDSINERYIT
jgi:thymidylate kinase